MGLLAKAPEFIDEMEHLEERSHDVIKINPQRLNFFRDFSTLVAIIINVILMGFYSYERLDNADGSIDYESSIQGWCSSAIQYLGYVQLFTTLLLWMGFLLNKTNIIIKSGWRAKTQENLKHLSSDVKYILKPLEPAFGEIRAKELPI
jgi:hypothetical protein